MQQSLYQAGNKDPCNKKLCTLRQELQLSKKHGKDYWTIYDPCNGKFFRIDKITFEIIKHWNLKNALKIQTALKSENIDLSLDEILNVDNFLRQNFLCVSDNKNLLLNSFNKQQKLKKSILQRYLFFKIPLFNPQKLLDFLYPKLSFLFKNSFWYLITFLALISFVLILRQWDLFWHSITNFLRFEGLFAYIFVIILSKCIHELGHALALRHYGLKVPSLGVAILMFMPLMYTDASESWHLTNPKARLKIAAAGILAEILLATIASFGWLFLDDGVLKSGCFVLATTNWVMTLFFNLNPLMRFDGYFILSDLLSMENLQSRAITQVKKKLAYSLFKLPIKYSENFSKRKTRSLIIFGIAVIAYRLSVIVGIISLVYMFFFKVLGIILLVHQVWKNLVLPLVKLTKWLNKNKKDIRLSKSSYISFTIVLVLLILLFVPLPKRLFVQGQLRSIEEYNIVIPHSGIIKDAISIDAQQVKKNQTVISLDSPKLSYELNYYQEQLNRLKQELNIQNFNLDRQQDRLITLEEVKRIEKAISLTKLKQQDLIIKAPCDGFIEWNIPTLNKGQTLGEKEIVGKILTHDLGKIVAYISEQDRDWVKVGDKGSFIASFDNNIKIPVKVDFISEHVVSELKEDVFNSKYGGSIVTDNHNNKPINSYYRVELSNKSNKLMPKELTGTLVLNTGYESIFKKLYHKIQGVLIRESVF